MTTYTFVMAAGTFDDVQVEREYLAGQPVALRVATLGTPEEIRRETAAAHGIIVTTHPLGEEAIAALGPTMRIIGRAGIGLDSIDLRAAERRGIAVLHCPDYATLEVATHAVALILALNRRLVQGDVVARTRWTAWRELTPVAPLDEQTVGVVGCGRIGRAVIARLRPLVGTIVAYDPYVAEVPDGARLVPSLDDLLAQSDIITLHPPLTEETRALIGQREIALLKRGAVLVNVARGALVDEGALAAALEEQRLGAVGLDVLETEPPPPDAAILRAPRVLLSPHFAWYSTASERRARTTTVQGMLDYLEGRSPQAGRLAVAPAV